MLGAEDLDAGNEAVDAGNRDDDVGNEDEETPEALPSADPLPSTTSDTVFTVEPVSDSSR